MNYNNDQTNKPTINHWLTAYEKDHFNNNVNLHENPDCNWFSWLNKDSLSVYIQQMNEVLSHLSKTAKFNTDEDFFVTLKEVSNFSQLHGEYANIIISKKVNKMPFLIITPDYSGENKNVELFVIQNKHKIVGSIQEICDYVDGNLN